MQDLVVARAGMVLSLRLIVPFCTTWGPGHCAKLDVVRTSDSESIGLTSQHVVSPKNRPACEWENDYEYVGTLRSGGQANVFKARAPTGGQMVAIKQPNDLPESQQRFPEEVKALQACQHRHVMPVLAHGARGNASADGLEARSLVVRARR
jgi:hypothetical protein